MIMNINLAQKRSTKVSCENAVQAVQSLESLIFKGWELHSCMCAMLCKMHINKENYELRTKI